MRTIEEKLASLNATSVWYFAKQDTNFDNAFKAVQIVDELGQQWEDDGTTAWSARAASKGLDSNHRILSVAQLLGILTKNNPFGKSQYKNEIPTPVYRTISRYAIGSPEYNALKTEQLLKLRMNAITDTRAESADYNIAPVLFTYEVFWRLKAKGITEISLGDFYTYVMTCKTHDEIDECVEYLLDPNRKETPFVVNYKSDSRVVTLIQNNLNLIRFTTTSVSIKPEFTNYFCSFFNGAYTSFVNMMKFVVSDVQMYQNILTNPIGLSVNFLDSSTKIDIEVKQVNLENKKLDSYSLQQIYFGAPGTGKSHEIKSQIKKHKSFRITFHPDTDYSSFVGAYKPTSVEVPMLTTLGEKAIPVKDMEGNPLTENKIIYTYVKQAFLNAYIEAWKEQANETPQPVYLVIEEINRGNCAQIFGDIFQLLDRNTNGFSDYAIVPDADLSRHVKKDLEKLVIANKEAINAIYEECEEDMVDKVVNGKVLLLPNNLYIWATMNTSDQSLFPIDSAFKRRWDWKYIKIADAHENWQIKVGTKTYDWWQFVQAINYFVFDATQSEDKNLGYFFAKAKDSIINAETFVSKVIFYLYTDVFKDYGFSGDIFKGANDDEMTFQSFYNADGSPCEAQIIRFIENVMFSDALPETLKVAVSTEDEDMNVYDEDEAVDNRQSSNRDKFMVNGAGSYGKCLAPFEAVKAYSKQNPQMNAAEIVQVWSNLNVNHMPHLVETEQEFEERAKTTKDVKFRVKAKRLELPNGEVIYVSNQFNPIRIAELIEKLNKANLGVNISLIDA